MDFALPVTLFGWIILALIALLISLTAYGLVRAARYLNDRSDNGAWDRLRKAAGTYVRALAQGPTFEDLANEQKKERAMLWLMILARRLKFDLTEHEADLLVEDAVWLMKNGLNKVADELLVAEPG